MADRPQIRFGDCLEGMRELADASVSAIVTDPPYGLEFMGKGWDAVLPPIEIWQEALRVLKPGGLALVFGGTRTYHRLACSLEDAGFELRDCFSWLYGSGFPKSLDVSKAIDKAAGHWRGRAGAVMSANGSMSAPNYERTDKGDPVTAAAAAWEGYGTALKPAWEPILVAMKPLDGTFAQNALEHGVAGINVEAGRIGATGGITRHTSCEGETGTWVGNRATGKVTDNGGRWPANVLLDEEAAAQLDEQSGEVGGAAPVRGSEPSAASAGNVTGKGERVPGAFHGDSGGASRFFYVAKASKSDRGAGNFHPTVKPVELMRQLVRLVKMPEQTLVLDPFAGSGSTLVACVLEEVDAIGFEREPEYALLAKDRVAAAYVKHHGELFAWAKEKRKDA